MSSRHRRSPAALAWFVLALASGSLPCSVEAQSGEPPSSAPQDPPADVTAAEPDPAVADAAVLEQARQRFSQGLALAQAGNCEGALAELEASFALRPRPNTMFNIAQCQEELHRYDVALGSYARYLELSDADAPDRAGVERTVRTLRGLLGTIHVDSNVPAEVWLGERVVGRAPGDVLVPGGTHAIEVRAEGRVPERREVTVAAQGRAALVVELREPTTVVNVEEVAAPPVPVPVFVGGVVVSAAAIGVATFFGVSALSERDRQRSLDPALPRDPGVIEQSALFSDVFFITGAVLAASTFAIGFVTDFGGGDEPSVSVGPGTVSGRF